MAARILRNALLLVLAYYGLLLAGAVLRFEALPDYARFYPWAENIRGILTGTPSWRDALLIALDEPLFETGRTLPDYTIAEWSLTIVPDKLAAIAAVAALLAIHWHLARRSCRLGAAALSGAGSVASALTSATLGWTVCCATPSWVVILAMLGLWAPTAMAVEPYGPPITIAGLVLLGAGVVLQVRANRGDAQA